MDEQSWQTELVRAGINITKLDVENRLVYFDFAYRPRSGGTRIWGKSVMGHSTYKFADMADELKTFVLEMRKELEG